MAGKLYHGKLVRDLIPQWLAQRGIASQVNPLDDEEFQAALRKKLQEEVSEFLSAPPENQKEELADILEVIHALCTYNNISIEELELTRRQKAQQKGAFTQRLFLKETEPLPSHSQ